MYIELQDLMTEVIKKVGSLEKDIRDVLGVEKKLYIPVR